MTPNAPDEVIQVSENNDSDWVDDVTGSHSRLQLPRSRTISGNSNTQGSVKVKRRGAPNKGPVTNNKVEKFKP